METQDPDERNDPARQPVEEAGGGVSEGFEQAEEELIENASPAEYGEADDEEPED
jgi:hypothetical protein